MIRLTPATQERFKRIRKKLLTWYSTNQRSFIWRDLRTTPYVVMVSEFMLQQTQAAMIEKKLPQFLKRFPTVRSLALAPTADVIRAWQGLGYNRRALNLQRAAQAILARGRKPFPNTLDELIELPGVGPYTASAILAFSFNHNVPVVDVNIERVLSRLWKPMRDTHETLPIPLIMELDRKILPSGSSGLWHQVLMDHGATICTKRKPQCEICPVRGECKSARNMMNSRSMARTALPKEVVFAGQPRRVWRGRVLKLIANRKIVGLPAIFELLGVHSDNSIEPLIQSILTDLISEGFVVRAGRSKFKLI